jgi:hypothetical protein
MLALLPAGQALAAARHEALLWHYGGFRTVLAMNPNFVRLAAIALVLATKCAAWGDEPIGYAPQDGILLLRNGQILRGKISCLGDRFVVALPTGEVRVRTDDVEMQCRNLTEGYERKRALIEAHDVQQHLDLAQWCIQHELLGYAANEIRDALTLEPNHPRIPLLERRLKLAQHKPAILKAVFETTDDAPTTEELDRLSRGMPPGTMEAFTNSIQPLLLNNCTSAGCHGPGAENPHRWVRVALGRTTSRRLTQRNLHTTLQLVDRQNPAESPLLVQAIQAHGNAKAPVFTDHQAGQLRQLTAWVFQVAQHAESPPPASVASQSTTLSQNLPMTGVRRAVLEEPLAPESANGGAAPLQPTEPPALLPVAPGILPQRTQPKRGEIPTGFVPKDPFDPEIFNRQFFPEN